MARSSRPHLLIVEARFYDDLADALLDGATAALESAGATCDVVTVPGALEVPAAIAFALDAPRRAGRNMTASSRSAASFAARPTISTSSPTNRPRPHGPVRRRVVAIGNGILTVENEAQAWVRARRGESDKGGDAARAALRHDRTAGKAGRRP